MQIKHYLRGLGAGLFISAVLMGIATSSSKQSLSDEEIKQRAAELGMVEEGRLLSSGLKNKDEVTEQTNDTKLEKEEIKKEPDKIEKESVATSIEPDSIEVKSDDIIEKPDKEETNKEEANKEENNKEENNKEEPNKEKISIDLDEPYDDRAMGNNRQDSKENDSKKGDATISDISKSSFTLQITKGVSSYSVAKLLEQGGVVESASKFDEYLCDNRYDNKISSGKFVIPEGADYEQIAKIITGGNN